MKFNRINLWRLNQAAFFVALSGVVGYSVYDSQKEDIVLSELAMENVEALAGGESNGGYAVVSKDEYTHTLHCSGNGSLSCTW